MTIGTELQGVALATGLLVRATGRSRGSCEYKYCIRRRLPVRPDRVAVKNWSPKSRLTGSGQRCNSEKAAGCHWILVAPDRELKLYAIPHADGRNQGNSIQESRGIGANGTGRLDGAPDADAVIR